MRIGKSIFKMWSIIIILALVLGFAPARTARAASTDLFFSEYIEGSGSNKAVEIYNGTGVPVDLAAGGYAIYLYSNGAITANTLSLSGTIAPGDVFVAAHPSADPAILAQQDVTSSSVINFNGNDAVVLVKAGGLYVDVIGQIGFNPGTEWGSGLTSTADNTLRRRSPIEDGDPIHNDPFDPAIQWNGFAVNTFDGLGSHVTGPEPDTAPAVTAIVPPNNAQSVALDQNLTITFNEDVNLAADWFTLSCSASGSHAAVLSGGPSVYTLDPDTDFSFGDTCTFTALQAGVSDVDTDDPPDEMVSDFISTFSTDSVCVQPYTRIHDIQGAGAASPLVGSVVSTYGIVVGDYEGASPNLRGFYLQSLDADQDADPETSEGVFVFNGSNSIYSVGLGVRVTGTVEEYQGQTQISQLTSTVGCGPAHNTVMPAVVTFPLPSTDYLERFEGMLVTLPQEMTVTEHFQLGRFGQVVISSNGRLMNPTSLVEPGAPAQALQAANNLNRIILDDLLNNQNADPIVFGRGGLPLSASNTLRGGDTITGLTGVMTYTWSGNAASGNAFRIRPQNSTAAFNFQPANPRPASAPARVGSLRVSGMNVLNYFNTFTGCTLGVGGASTSCRGAENQAEFDRQWLKTVAAILGTQADIVGLGEIENDGYAPDSAIAMLVDQLNAASAPGTYAFIDADTATAQVNALGTDAIKVGFIYKPAAVIPLGTAVLNTTAFVNGGDATARSRPALAQTFEEVSTGARFTVVTNHLKSKGSACDLPDTGDGQGNCSQVRANAALELVNWLASDPTVSGDADILIIGDLNSYAKEDPIDVLLAGGYTNLIELFGGASAYSYVFDGQWGYLDHALGNTSLTPQIAAINEWHINADEPSVLDYNTNFKTAGQQTSLYAPDQYRMSDHDAVLVDINLTGGRPSAEAGGPYTVNEGSSVQLTGSGSDSAGGAVSFAWDLDNDLVYETTGQNVNFTAVDGPASLVVNLKVTNAVGQSQTDSATVTVSNVAPVLGAITAPRNPVLINIPITASAAFSDPGLQDTYTAQWDWGDGFTTSGGNIVVFNGSGTVSSSHAYSVPGIYEIALTLTDKDGGSATRTFHSVAVYQSFTVQARGKGSYYSEPGSYLPKPTKGGLTTFDFNARIMRQSNGRYALTGYLNLQLRNAGMTFKAANVKWLSTVPGTAEFSGTGSLNGARGYDYFVSVLKISGEDYIYVVITDPFDHVVYETPGYYGLESGSILIRQ